MKSKKSGTHLLIVLEIVALIAVLVFGVVQKGRINIQFGKKPNTEQTANHSTVTEGTEDTEVETIAVEQTETEEDATIVFSKAVKEKLASMTLEEKVAQMFLITPEALTHADKVTVAGNATKEAISNCPVGGFVYSEQNFQGKDQTKELLTKTQDYSKERMDLPMFLAIEEIGGEDYSPVASANEYTIQKTPAEIAKEEDAAKAKTASAEIAEYLSEQGFVLNIAPIADLAGGVNKEYDKKTYGSNSAIASMMVAESISGYHEKGIKTAVGAFPGESVGTVNKKSFEEWKAQDALVYQSAINANCECMVLANVIYEPLTESSNTICSISENVVKYIREELNYTGLLMTDCLCEEVVTLNYSSKEVAVKAVKAGVNIIYCPENFEEAYQGIMDAIDAGEIAVEVIDESVGRILTQKMASNS
ncbi:MAG: hypothetical protein IKJ01_02040 [Lachnospiraceae bacterium]|nr:hypothetical protein [Lachnospiraceae bacterium]